MLHNLETKIYSASRPKAARTESVRLSVSVCLGRAGHTDEHTHDVNSLFRSVSSEAIRAIMHTISVFVHVQKPSKTHHFPNTNGPLPPS